MKRSRVGYWLFLLPALIVFTLVVLIPTFSGIYYSLTDWSEIGQPAAFVGLENFKQAAADRQFIYSACFTTLFAVAAAILVNAVGYLLALFVTRKCRGRHFFRGAFFLPNLIGGLFLGFIWQFIFTKVCNALNISFLQNWLTNAQTSFAALLIVTVWQMAGYMMILYIAALENIPASVKETAAIDGVRGAKKLFHITLPLISPAIAAGIFLTLTNCFKLFDQNLALTRGGPNNSTQMLALNIYHTAFSFHELGQAQARALLFLVVVAVLTGVQLYLHRRSETRL